MSDIDFIQAGLKAVRTWREDVISRIKETGLDDLSYRPSTGMSEFGWVLAHQAAVFDFSLNVLIKQETPVNTELFGLYRPGTEGEWSGISYEEIQDYYDSGELAILEWAQSESESDFKRVIEEGTAPNFFVGMTVYEVISNMFSHLSYHTGQLAALGRDWMKSRNN